MGGDMLGESIYAGRKHHYTYRTRDTNELMHESGKEIPRNTMLTCMNCIKCMRTDMYGNKITRCDICGLQQTYFHK
jgi:hypothetical protein